MTSKHIKWKCDKGYEKCDDCNFDTHTELFICAVCGGAEASLPTDCPGREMTPNESEQVQNEALDYKDGAWVHLGPRVRK